MMPSNDPAPFIPSPNQRERIEQLLARLARGYVEGLRPMERGMVQALIRARGWDLDHLATGRGPLAPVTDYGLAVLVRVFAEELNAVDAEGLRDTWDGPPPPRLVDAALDELRRAMG